MRKFFSGIKFRILLCLCAALLIGIFVSAASASGAGAISSVLGYITKPFEKAASYIAFIADDFSGKFVSASYYKEQASELSEELESCREQLVDYENLKYKLNAYEEFLGVKERSPDFVFLPASVILRDKSDPYGSFTLSSGTDDGVDINDPVIFGSSLVGVVRSVSEKTCVVYTLLNPDISVGAYEIRTREECYIEAENALTLKGLVRLSGLSKTTPVSPGGIVCSSGIGGIFPKDLIIGTVSEVVTNSTDTSAYATVEPNIDPSRLTDVFIITDFAGKAS